jgi:hypothetical protein
MKRLKGGPELKMSDIKVPVFLEELYYDLRDRRLLPLVALAIVAIVAVPFLLSSGSEEEAPPPPAAAAASSASDSGAADLTVVKAEPGLREYRKRLGHRSPTDPFRQSHKASGLSGSDELGSPGNNGFESTTTVRSSSTSITPSGTTKTTKTTKSANGKTTTKTQTETTKPGQQPESQGGTEGGSGDLKPGQTLYAYAIDFRYVKTVTNAEGKSESSDPVTRTEVLGAVPLPGEKEPVVTFIGASPSTRKPLFMISSEVTSVYGEGKCLAGTGVCQLMELEVGMPVTFVYGPNGARYKFTVLKVEPVVTGHS